MDAIERIERFTQNLSFKEYLMDDKTSNAVTWNLEIIGEAANRMPDSFLEQYPMIEWRKIIGLRHRIVHEYFGIDSMLVWRIIQNDLPNLKSSLQSIHNQMNQ
ncbi:MAG: DUF86 domain-containing protein [Candidatus Omnitrophota bacterium]